MVLMTLVAPGCSSDARAPRHVGAAATTATTTTTDAVLACASGSGSGCTLREVAARRKVLIGAAAAAGPLDHDPAYQRLLARQFDSVTPENQAKWPVVEPTAGMTDWATLDALVRFAVDHGMAVRGHALIWGQASSAGTPAWVTDITDPTSLRKAVEAHIHDEVSRYAGRIDRWDVVNEPLQTDGPALDANHFLDVLGRGYIADAFRAAHAADPSASLWLNENNVESVPAKADALVALVDGLRSDGVPIDGVGLQMHLRSGHAPAPGVVSRLVGRLRALGVRVAITELDVPVSTDGSDAAQVAAYRQVVRECLAAGCDEITVWGVSDAHTWLDADLGRSHTDPLLFDERGSPKQTFNEVRAALAAG